MSKSVPLTTHETTLLFSRPGSAPIALSERQQFSGAHRLTKHAARGICLQTSRWLDELSPNEHAALLPSDAGPRRKRFVPLVRKYELVSDFRPDLPILQLQNPTAVIVAVRGPVHHEAAVIHDLGLT